jgi:hypothetical protein
MENESKVVRKPTRDDANLLVQLFAIAQSERIARSFLWYIDFFGEEKDPSEIDYETFLKKNPRGSEGYFKWTAIAAFFETVGVLVRNETLGESLVFDRWPVERYWRHLEALIEADRQQGLLCDTAHFADNFEWLAAQAKNWRASGKGYARWKPGREKG